MSIFGIKRSTQRPYEFDDDTYMVVSFEFDLDKMRIDREVYNLFDLLGDIGGLETALILILGSMNALVNYEAFEDFLVSKLFRPSKRITNNEEMFEMGKSTGVRSEVLNPKKNGCLRNQLYKIKKLLICKKESKSDRRQRLFEKGRKELQYETDALTLLKYVRGL